MSVVAFERKQDNGDWSEKELEHPCRGARRSDGARDADANGKPA